jgi:hypothetical protein
MDILVSSLVEHLFFSLDRKLLKEKELCPEAVAFGRDLANSRCSVSA